MTGSTERAADAAPEGSSGGPPEGSGPAGRADAGERWRASALARQDRALPGAAATLTCPAPYGRGGLGRHMQELATALARAGQPHERISEDAAPAQRRHERGARLAAAAARPLGRVSPAWRLWAASVDFDARAAERLAGAEQLIAFNGTALRQLELAPALGYRLRTLVSANAHFDHLLRRHELAHRSYPLEAIWPARLLARNLREYELADTILVASAYVRDSFLAAGFAAERLVSFPLTPDPRFTPAPAGARADTFDVVYVGALTVHKGVPLLVDAFRRLGHADMRLRLVGGWKSRGMRRHLAQACAEDPRIEVCPGDPLPRLHAASLYAHPAYEDGFAYAPAEALACGVPVLVSEDTGMKDMIAELGGGAVLPTGDRDALCEAIDAAYRGEDGRG